MKKGSKAHLRHLKKVSVLGGIAKGKLIKSPYERFMEAIRVDENNCWIWTKNLSRGYGTFKINGNRSPVKATRWAYEYFKNEKILSSRIFVCHKCDVRACVNPDHLFLGTTQVNMDDCREKDRFVKGSNHHQAKLTEDKVREIRRLKKEGFKAEELAEIYGVNKKTIFGICAFREWKHVI